MTRSLNKDDTAFSESVERVHQHHAEHTVFSLTQCQGEANPGVHKLHPQQLRNSALSLVVIGQEKTPGVVG